MSKKTPTPQDDESFDDAIAAASAVQPAAPAAAPKAEAAPLTPIAAFFAGVRSREANQTSLAKLAKESPDFAAHIDAAGFNALTLALLARKTELAKALVEMGSDVNLASKAMGWCPLVVAAGCAPGDDAMPRLLLAKGADPSSKTHDGLYAITSACTYGNLALAKTLLDAGAHAAPADAGWLPIIAAAGSGNVDLVNLLVERGANPDQALGERNGFRSIHQAAKAGHPEVVTRLAALGVKVDAMDNEGCTPLHFAAQRADLATATVLLKAGANPALENLAGKTPAELCSKPDVAKALAPKGDARVKHPQSSQAKKAAKALADAAAPATKKAAAKKSAAKPAAKGDKKAMQALAQTAAKKIAPSKKKPAPSVTEKSVKAPKTPAAKPTAKKAAKPAAKKTAKTAPPPAKPAVKKPKA